MIETQNTAKYHRILLKLSGESLAAPNGQGIDPGQARTIAELVKSVHETGVEVAIVIGAGNRDERFGADGRPRENRGDNTSHVFH